MTLIEFIREYANRKNAFVNVILEFYWLDTGIDEEYCFEGKPFEFIEHYTKDYDCIQDVDVLDVHELKITDSEIYIKIFKI